MRETETYRLPETTPYENHGRTRAGWVFANGFSLGVLLAGLGLIFTPVLVWAGVCVIVLSIVASFALHVTGHGQPNRLTNTAKGGAWYND